MNVACDSETTSVLETKRKLVPSSNLVFKPDARTYPEMVTDELDRLAELPPIIGSRRWNMLPPKTQCKKEVVDVVCSVL